MENDTQGMKTILLMKVEHSVNYGVSCTKELYRMF